MSTQFKMTATPVLKQKSIAIFLSQGALGDCARHCILHAMHNKQVCKIKVISTASSLSTLNGDWWHCACGIDHGRQLKLSANAYKIEKIVVDNFTDPKAMDVIDLSDIDAVVSGLGNRQICYGSRYAKKGTENIIRLMERSNVTRLVMMSSMGVESMLGNDKPCLEWREEGKFMEFLANTICRREYNDLAGAENSVSRSNLNFVVVRAVGLGEKVSPAGECFVQRKKFDDVVGADVAKTDVGRFLLAEAIEPTIERQAIVLGSRPEYAYKAFDEPHLADVLRSRNVTCFLRSKVKDANSSPVTVT